METITLSELKQQILTKNRVPISGVIELTLRCNLGCQFCYCDIDNCHSHELTTSEICHIFDEITESGCMNLVITGGEPLVRKDFKTIYSYAKQKGLLITLYTNATLITEEIADFLADMPPIKVEVTMYGHSKEVYEQVTERSGSYDRFMAGINFLLQRNIPLELKTTVCKKNYHEVSAISDFAKTKGLRYRFDAMLDPKIDGDKLSCQSRLTPEQIVELDGIDPQRSENLKRLINRNIQIEDEALVYICGAGESSFHIDPYGKLSMCMLTRYASYDLRKGNFKDGFYNHFSVLRSQKHEKGKMNQCNQCSLVTLCTNCPGSSYIENGTFQYPSSFHCEVTHLRAKHHQLI